MDLESTAKSTCAIVEYVATISHELNQRRTKDVLGSDGAKSLAKSQAKATARGGESMLASDGILTFCLVG